MQAFPFLRLPPELRNAVYSYILRVPEDTAPLSYDQAYDLLPRSVIEVEHDPDPDVPQGSTARGAILRTCRQVYLEATPIAYRINTFGACSPETIQETLTVIGSLGRANITSIFLHWGWIEDDSRQTFQMLGDCPRLSQLHLVIFELALLWTGDVSRRHFIKGIDNLRQIGGLKILTVRVCMRSSSALIDFEAWLKEEMMKPRPE